MTPGVPIGGAPGADETPFAFDAVVAGRALEHISDGVMLLDADWRIGFANATAAREMEHTIDELVGHDFFEVFPDADCPEFGDRYREAMDTQETQEFEAYYGALRGWFAIRAVPSPSLLTLCFQNTTERRAAVVTQEALVHRLEEAMSRQSLTQSVVVTLAEALSVEDVARAVVQLANQALGTMFAGLALLTDDGTGLRFVTLDPLASKTVVAEEVPLGVPSALTDCVRLRQPMYHSSRSELLATYPPPPSTVEDAGNHAFTNVPLVVGGRVLGALSMSWAAERAFTEQDRTFVRMLAAQCAQAVERTQLISRQRDVAETLQQAMLPDQLPTVEGAEVSACYLPTTTDMSVGGDWYDAFTLDDGRLVLAVGDVSGHGVQAASVMGQVRNSLRAYIVDGHSPAMALAKLDTLVDRSGHGLFATAIVAIYDPASGDLVWSNAGHPPLLARTSAGLRFLIGHVGAPVGVLGPEAHVDEHLRLEVGEFLIGYTDGLIERRREDISDGLARLIATVDVAAAQVAAGDWCANLVEAVLGDSPREDDICVLVLKRV